MNIALIIAGGVGKRTGQDVPKQFLTINDTPIIVYTMQNIESTGLYDEIYVVSSAGWQDFIVSYAKQFGIASFKGCIGAGESRFDSYSNGIEYLFENGHSEDFVSIIDANRPLIPKTVFEENLKKLSFCDCVVATEPCYDSMYLVSESGGVERSIDRTHIHKGQVPESAKVKTACEICEMAKNDGNTDLPLASLMLKYGKNTAFSRGSSKSFKITTSDDISIFKALVDAR